LQSYPALPVWRPPQALLAAGWREAKVLWRPAGGGTTGDLHASGI